MKIFYTLLLSFWAVAAYGSDGNARLMELLKNTLANKDYFDRQKEKRVLSLQQQVKECQPQDLERKYGLYSRLFEEYRSYQYDSAYVYTQKLIKLSLIMKDVPKQYDSKIKLGIILISSGMFKETLDCLNEVDPKALNRNSKLCYYRLKCSYYVYLANYNNDKYYSKGYREIAQKYLDTAISLTDRDSFEQLMYKAELPDTAGQQTPNYRYYELLLYHHKLSAHQTAMIASALGDYNQGGKRMELLLIAAINDIRSSTKETNAIFKVGCELYKGRRVKDAYLFMQEALNNAEFYGSRLHKIEISSVLADIAANKILLAENEKNKFLVYLLSSLTAIVVITSISFIVFIQLKRLRVKELIIADKNKQLEKNNLRLAEDARIKEVYIGYFFNVYAEYIVKLEKLKRNVERKIKTEKYGDILKLLGNVDIKKERDELFRTFDRVFLLMFPDFITLFNALLKPEDQIWPKGDEVLNPHLRIFALLRLGISDNETIAKILEYTVSTIYTYKIRIKSKAIVGPDEFINRIMGIQVIDNTSTTSTGAGAR
ncbi:DUF6377 domain-containing protein [Mucilaginibacter rubeus]|uniref:DUF6377 domain-containing protein n=1 Tax=Mucilaginibacter rubeus TaxID=2027860 RepID=A0A5C1HWY9_9SPHI|nr:DUF6377 domain-containing protein [Mucilaginibacter rubeus]QEM10422.1 hypothetical protein DEO27_010425 [Mucilaginibacter rubeus]